MSGASIFDSLKLDLASTVSATSGVIDTAPISNEGWTGAFSVGGGSARDTNQGPVQTGGAVPDAFGAAPSAYAGDRTATPGGSLFAPAGASGGLPGSYGALNNPLIIGLVVLAVIVALKFHKG